MVLNGMVKWFDGCMIREMAGKGQWVYWAFVPVYFGLWYTFIGRI
jgi:hypothetical protein